MGEGSGLARFAEYGIASTRAFTMRLAVIGQRLDCKRRSCQLNAAALGLTFRVWSLHAPPPCSLHIDCASDFLPHIIHQNQSNPLHSTSFVRPSCPTIHHRFTHRFFVGLSLPYSALQWEQPSPHPNQKAPLPLSLSFPIKLDYVLTNSL